MPLEIFPVAPSFGARTIINYPHTLTQTVQGYDVINIQNIYPILEFDISRARMAEVDKNAILQLFEIMQGSQDYFLFRDYSDYQVTAMPFEHNDDYHSPSGGYNRGFTQGIIVQDQDGNFRVAKKYEVGTVAHIRPITHPEVVTIYRNGSPINLTVDYETGIVTGGALTTDSWTGRFYVPTRFAEDNFTFTKDSLNLYSFNSLKLREVKLDLPRINNHYISKFIDIYFSLSYNFKSEAKKEFKTIIDKYDNEKEDREQQFDYLQQRYVLSQRKVLSRKDIQYLISWYRCCIGSFSAFKFYQFENAYTFNVSWDSPLEIEVAVDDSNLNYQLYAVNNLVLKSTDLTDINILRTTICNAWQIQAKSETTPLRFCDHDQDVIVGGDVYKSIKVRGYATGQSSTLDIDNTEVEGSFLLDAIDETDLIAGKYQSASVILKMLDWYAQTEFTTVMVGYVGEQTIEYTKSGAKRYKLEVLSQIRDLSKRSEKVTSSRCRHKFLSQGLGKCNKSFTVGTAPNDSYNNPRIRVLVTGVVDNRHITANASGDSFGSFVGGTLLFETGILQGREFFIQNDGTFDDNIALLFGMPVLPSVGDQILLTKKCEKTIQACNDWGNVKHFGGFPDLPGIDNVIAPIE